MIPHPDSLSPPDPGTVSDLLSWRPEHGVLSVYIAIDPGDRRASWRTAVRNGLSEAVASAGDGDHDHRKALQATVDRLERDLEEERKDEHSGLIGFVEVAASEGADRWYASLIPPQRIEVRHAPGPQVHQLLELLDDGAPLGVAAVSSERVRLLDWRLGRVEQLHDWELSYFGEDWKERKSHRPDPSRGGAVSASGRDQYDQRLEANRERFAEQTGRLAHGESNKHGWERALVFGDRRYVGKFTQGFGNGIELIALDGDLVSEPTEVISRRVEEILSGMNRTREAALIDRIKEAAYAEGRSSLGAQETLQALTEGRVEHLVYDATRDSPETERMVELALGSGAAITPVEGDSAAAIAEQDGVVALLRY